MLTPADHAARRGRLTASQVAQVLGPAPGEQYSPYGGPWAVWAATHCPEALPPVQGVHIDAGHGMEAWLCRWVGARLRGAGLASGEVETGIPTITLDDWAGATLDGRIDGCPIEAKASAEWSAWGPECWVTEGSDHVPQYYLIQCASQCYVTGASTAWLPVGLMSRQVQALVGRAANGAVVPWGSLDEMIDALVQWQLIVPRLYRIDPAPALMEALAARGWEWWARHLRDGEPPPLDSSEACSRALARMREARPGTVLQCMAGTTEGDLLADYYRARADVERATEAEATARARLQDAMGSAVLAVDPMTGEGWQWSPPNKKGSRVWTRKEGR